MNTPKDKTVKVVAEPFENHNPFKELAHHMRSELKNKNKLQDVKL